MNAKLMVLIVSVAQSVSAQEPTIFTIAIAPGLPPKTYSALREKVLRLYAEEAKAGDTIELILTPSCDLLARLSVPEGTPRQRLMRRSELQSLAKVLATFDHPPTATADLAGNLNVPVLTGKVAAMPSGNAHRKMFWAGQIQFSSVFHDTQWNTEQGTGGLVPKWDNLFFEWSECPFGVKNKPRVAGVKVYWLVSSDWAKSEFQQVGLPLWWQGYLQSLGGSLRVLDSSLENVFDGFAGRSDPAMPTVVIPSISHPRMGMLSPPVVTASTAPASVLTDALSNALPTGVSPEHVLIGAAWQSLDGQADIDIWVEDPGLGQTINFSHKTADFGELYRDIMYTQPNGLASTNHGWTTTCEVAELAPERFSRPGSLEAIKVYLDVFRATEPVTGIVRVVWHGRQHDLPFHFEVAGGEHGDQARDRDIKERSMWWKRIDLESLFQ